VTVSAGGEQAAIAGAGRRMVRRAAGLVVKDQVNCLIWVRIPLESGLEGGRDPRAKAGRP
jgi:hypothetical protein